LTEIKAYSPLFEIDQTRFREEIPMSDQNSQDQDKIDEYLRVIQERILAPIQKTEIRDYSTATLLLLFAAIDGLGKLLHPNDKAGSNARIREFLDYMGDGYEIHKEELLALRNSLVHNAINVASFLSRTEVGRNQHLKKMGADDFIHVNTRVMYEDFVSAFSRFQADIKDDLKMMKRAADQLEWRETADRLEWGEDNPLDHVNIATPTPPPPVEFIYAK
jgi:hypothetical protein